MMVMSTGRGCGPHCSIPSVRERASSAKTRYPSQRSRSQPAGPAHLTLVPQHRGALRTAIPKITAAIAGGDSRFHHSGP